MCGADRSANEGFCGAGAGLKVARAALHYWEEPCISGTRGSGAVFFSGCTLKCCFCQNEKISEGGFGAEISVERLGRIFLELQEKGAHNINLVTADPYVRQVKEAVALVREELAVPVVYNCSGYQSARLLRELDGLVDVYLPDLKFMSRKLAGRYLKAPDYFEVASRAIPEMIRQTGGPVYGEDGMLKKGVLIRHLVMPGARTDSEALLAWAAKNLEEGSFLVSLMSQYAPAGRAFSYPEINRRVTTYEYEKVRKTALLLGLTDGYRQHRASASGAYTPSFDLEGVLQDREAPVIKRGKGD
ncbi:MAG: radical SAM protein [Lachnospiraceae bacterium]|nr:radical SAM protein [Lachnospiraceae bacterium]